jgi:hypothetical protein
MPYRLSLGSTVLSTSRLEERDPCMGVAWGQFEPTPEYELVRPVFRLFAAADELPASAARDEAFRRYYRARDAMRLSVSDADGAGLPCGDVHVLEVAATGAAGVLQLEVHSFPAEP